jgi:beta-carotene ketolase (CrtW type)
MRIDGYHPLYTPYYLDHVNLCEELESVKADLIAAQSKGSNAEAWLSLGLAVLSISSWAVSLRLILGLDFQSTAIAGKLLLLLWQTFLYTGLFVTAHDAMHGVVFPLNRMVNDATGTVMLSLYGLFSFQQLRARHQLHHQCPASETDPDYCVDCPTQLWTWYGSFMARYWSWPRFLAFVLIFSTLNRCCGIASANLAWGWIYPSVLSSLQLFYFGTYLPHRRPSQGYRDHHCATTIVRPYWLSLLACYHFGYHCEHHAYPQVPWWRLPHLHHQWRNNPSGSLL